MMFFKSLIAASIAATSLVGAAPTPNDNAAGTPAGPSGLEKRGTGKYSVYYYNDYNSCIDSYYNAKPAYESQENVPINGGACLRRLAFPYYTLEWYDSTLVNACKQAGGSCGTDCADSGQAGPAAIVCDSIDFNFSFSA